MGRILVIDGDTPRRTALTRLLQGDLHEVESATTVLEGLEMAPAFQPDLVVADAVLTDDTGTSACAAFRQGPATSGVLLIVLGESVEEADRVAALEDGADDYVTRPFSARELVLRTRAVLRRARAIAAPDSLEYGAVTIDRLAWRVTVAGVTVALAPLEREVLVNLVAARGNPLSRAELLARIWRTSGRPYPRAVDGAVRNLREKLPAGPRLVRTVRGFGYRLAFVASEEIER